MAMVTVGMWEDQWMEAILEPLWHGSTEISTLPTMNHIMNHIKEMIIDTAVKGRPDKVVVIRDLTRPAPPAGWVERVLREGEITVNIEDHHPKDTVEEGGACLGIGNIVVEEKEHIDHTTDHSQVHPLLMEPQKRPPKQTPSHQKGKEKEKEIKEVIIMDQRCKVTQ